MKKFLLSLFLAAVSLSVSAQRFTDQLGRGLVAVPTGSTDGSTTNFVSWRRLANEYYDVTYNLYKDGALLASGLTKTSYDDNNKGLPTTTYQVAAVVNGVEQTKCAAITPWTQYVYKYTVRCPTGYLDIALAAVYDRNGNDVSDNYEPNDAEMADLDGDGELEIIIKRLNTLDASVSDTYGEMYSAQSTQYVVFDAYDVNWQTGAATLMWRIDCGPNMVSLNSTEVNIIAYDWDEDGKAEVVLRGADNMIVYGSDGKTPIFTIGDMTVNTRNSIVSHTNSQYAWTRTGAEYLIYMNGQTGAKYQVTEFPLKRLESGESNLKTAWGDDYGHRSSKYFMGAPFLDGRKASLFLARGIYTRHKMVALDLDRASHTWSTRWTWNNNTSGSIWYGQGNHNYVIADVDMDGRDEIVYGSMVIDDNGKGLSSTGLGHGDAIHVSDLDPYRHGLEVYACNEDKPNMNYRNATTSEIYYRSTGTSDDGRALMANFSNAYPGSFGRSISSGIISSVTDAEISDWGGDSFIAWGDLNFRIYWDGDLCSEILNSPGTAREASIEKPGTGRLFTSSGCNMNNDSKNNPCFQGDIIGDWREEIVVRCGKNLRVYTTGLYTSYSLPCLWFDHQYRQAMVWQMMAYNQPPHLSYFLGEMEGITVAPPPLTTRGRTEIATNGIITSAHNGQHLLVCDGGNIGIDESGASPSVLTINVASTVAGNNDNNSISYSYASCQLGASIGGTNCKGDLTGSTRLVKQGDGLLKMTARTFSYTGNTDIWGGSVYFRGTLENSPVWMNRHTNLYTAGTYGQSLTMEYGSTLYPNYTNADATSLDYATATINTLNLHEGSRIVFQLDVAGNQSDAIDVKELNIRKQTWENGPQYLAPVFEIQPKAALPNGTYKLGKVEKLGSGSSLDDIIVECDLLPSRGGKATLKLDDGVLYLVVEQTGTIIGSIDNTTAWWGDHSDDYKLRDGQRLHLEFHNYNAGDGAAHNNFVLVCTNDVTRNDDANGYVEHFVARADDWGWGADWSGIQRTYVCDWGENFVSYLNGAYVTMDVDYMDGTVTVYTTVTSADGLHTYTDRVVDTGVTDDVIRLFLTVDYCHLLVDNMATKTIDQNWLETVFEETFDTQNADAWRFSAMKDVTQSFVSTGTDTYAYEVYTTSTRTLSRDFTGNSLFTSAERYVFEFDWGTGGSNMETSTLTVLSDNSDGKLLTVSIPSGWATISFLSNDEEVLATYDNGRPLSTPASLFHFKITGNPNGVFLTVTKDNVTYVNNRQLYSGLCHVTGLRNVLGRSYNHTVFDDLCLSVACGGAGDVNCDGKVDISDVTSLVNHILGKAASPFSLRAADVNEDGSIDISDVTGLVNIILGK